MVDSTKPGTMRIGIISDTHGLLRPEAVKALQGCAHILHAGDVGDPRILTALRRVAPVTAIRGNIDRSGPCAALPTTEAIELGGKLFYLVHDRNDLDVNPRAATIAAVIFGHSHTPEISRRNGVLYFNPGSAGPRRFHLPVCVGIIECTEDALQPSICRLLE